MSNQDLTAILDEIRAARTQTLTELVDLTEGDFDTPTDIVRWDDIRRVLLRFGDHMREHSNQLEAARYAIDRDPTMPQRMLSEGEVAWGKLLASTLGLEDEDLDVEPADGSWTIRQVLSHILETERHYLETIRRTKG
jgi:hypothetical protein